MIWPRPCIVVSSKYTEDSFTKERENKHFVKKDNEARTSLLLISSLICENKQLQRQIIFHCNAFKTSSSCFQHNITSINALGVQERTLDERHNINVTVDNEL